MKTTRAMHAARMGGVALTLSILLTIGGAPGCGADKTGGGKAAVTAKADAVQVTYYYLPG
jgi:hypothetical protein